MSLLRCILVAVLIPLPAFAGSPAGQQVVEQIKGPEVTVVHLWAPWCSNCQAELRTGGWTAMIKNNPRARFCFVSIWNGGDDGRAMLNQFHVANQPNVTVLADPGPRGKDHITQFAGLPVSWIPTTWIFKSGELRYALNYGEIRFSVLQQLVTDSESSWSHKDQETAAK